MILKYGEFRHEQQTTWVVSTIERYMYEYLLLTQLQVTAVCAVIVDTSMKLWKMAKRIGIQFTSRIIEPHFDSYSGIHLNLRELFKL